MVQKEVAHRLVAKVGTKEYGRLTVVVGAYLDIDYCFTIPPSVFIPKPKVDSAFIRFNRKRTIHEIQLLSLDPFGMAASNAPEWLNGLQELEPHGTWRIIEQRLLDLRRSIL